MRLIREHIFITACILIAAAAVAFVLFFSLNTGQEDVQSREDAIKSAVEERALQCYVIEDAYPESLSYLEENYGLAVNKKDYMIIYTPYAENLPPEVRVIYRGEKQGEAK
ncbi:MAG: hypothetical protein IJI20_04075 [Firmicutes bacterium]|nr:hypothetical protein [Bacillota bacterium]